MNIHEETLKIARNLIEKDPSLTDWIISKFPELKESEDERIRKELIAHFKTNSVSESWSGLNVKKVIAWLEKQGEQNPISLEDTAKLFLEKLSESPYNNKPITDAQVITKELINFLKDTNTYNPNAINEQKPAEWRQDNVEELTEFENVMMHIGSSFFGENAGLNPNDTTCIKEQANLLLELVPKQEWSEEDEKMAESCENAIVFELTDNARDDELKTDPRLKWLKSLKDRVQPQDTWKPSDEQIEYLSKAIFTLGNEGDCATAAELFELRDNLKMLREK